MDKELIIKQAVNDNKGLIKKTDDLFNMALQVQHLLMMYESAIKQLTTQFEILEDEYEARHQRNPINTISSRIKEPMSIAEKLQRKGYEITLDNMVSKLMDIAGIRITCPFISDVYHILEILKNLEDINILEIKDYIQNPKQSGYRSLHIIVTVRVCFSDEKRNIPVEIQVRTIAMDFWASLEHQMHYKKDYEMPPNIKEELKSIADTISDTDIRMQNLAKNMPDFKDYTPNV